MADVLDEAFDDPAERRAYEEFVANQERGAEPFDLDRPALVCRWRMAGKRVPLLNRHIRALAARRVNGAPLPRNLVSWAKQHVEWSLAEGDVADPDGVLMLVVDVNGNAAMSTGPYEPLADATREALRGRAEGAQVEAAEAGVAPEVLCSVRDEANGTASLTFWGLPAAGESGAASLVRQLAETRGVRVAREPLGADAAAEGASFFLVSDEHGVVLASDCAAHPFGRLCAEGFEKLRARTR